MSVRYEQSMKGLTDALVDVGFSHVHGEHSYNPCLSQHIIEVQAVWGGHRLKSRREIDASYIWHDTFNNILEFFYDRRYELENR